MVGDSPPVVLRPLYVNHRLQAHIHSMLLKTVALKHFCPSVCFCLFGWFVCVLDKVWLGSPGWPGTHSITEAGLDLCGPPVSASLILGLEM